MTTLICNNRAKPRNPFENNLEIFTSGLLQMKLHLRLLYGRTAAEKGLRTYVWQAHPMGQNNAGGPVLRASICCLSRTATSSTTKNFFVVISKVSPISSDV